MNKYYHITTFGCAMNVSDSERVATICEMMGYQRRENIEDANLIIINSCSIRQKAEDRVMGMGKKITELKAHNDVQAVLTGCMAKRDIRQASDAVNTNHQMTYAQDLLKKLKWLDQVVEIDQIYKLPKILNQEMNVSVNEYLSIPPKVSNQFQSYIPISTGCNKFCTFCIVPFTRGKEVYRSLNEIKNEFHQLLSNGSKEIILLGQNVNSWRDINDSYAACGDEHDFAYLLDDLAQTKGDYWIRFTSSHPYDINLKLIDVLKKHSTIPKQIHFALQSGDDNVLKRMNRHYTVAQFKDKIKYIKEMIPDISISTDLIVGFCGETEQEFENTRKVIEELQFDQVYISEFSNRKGTLADKFYQDDVPTQLKALRKEIINEIVATTNYQKNLQLIGTCHKVLIYKKKKNLVGRTGSSKDVEISFSGDVQIGEFVDVKISNVSNWSLQGILIKS